MSLARGRVVTLPVAAVSIEARSSLFDVPEKVVPCRHVNVDRNLLFAVIALQDDLIDQTQFADVCAGWAMRLERPLADLLIERKWITEQDRADVERKLERKLKKNQGDVRATLGAVAEIEAREVLEAIDNPQVLQSLHAAPAGAGHVLVETLVPPAGPARLAAVHPHPPARRRRPRQDLDRP